METKYGMDTEYGYINMICIYCIIYALNPQKLHLTEDTDILNVPIISKTSRKTLQLYLYFSIA